MPPVKKTNRGKHPRSHMGPLSPIEDSVIDQEELKKRTNQLEVIRRTLLQTTTEEKQKEYIGRAIKIAFGFNGKKEQIEVLWQLLFQKQDTILVAQTSFGKSLIFQILPLLVSGGMIVIILPLNAIGKDQWTKIRELPGAYPIMLCAENNNNTTLAGIRNGIYTHVLVSPEIACSKRFGEIVLNDPKFKSKVAAVTVDEVHLVIDWGTSFRKSYTMLRSIRQVIGDRPWFGCSATLDQETLEKLQELRVFKDDFHIIRTSIDRSEIAIVRKTIPRNKKASYNCLYFLIDDALPPEGEEAQEQVRSDMNTTDKARTDTMIDEVGHDAIANLARQSAMGDEVLAETDVRVPKISPALQNIKKAIVFFDQYGSLGNCIGIIRAWLMELGYSRKEVAAVVRGYHSNLEEEDKECIYEEFKKPDSIIRILCATDAISVGCNIPDILIIVQYGLPRGWSFNMVMQRFGRAARKAGLKGTAIFFVEEKFVGERSLPAASSSDVDDSEDDRLDDGARAGTIRFEATDDGAIQAIPDADAMSGPTRRRTDDTRTRAKLPDIMYKFCNLTDGCLRAAILDHYLEPPQRRQVVPCCSNCDEDLAASLAERTPEKSQRKRKKDPRNSAIISKLIELWCKGWLKQTFPNAVIRADPRLLIADSDRDEISDKVAEINDVEGLEKYLPRWEWGEEALLAFWGALQEARDATLQASVLTELKRNLQEWPWNLCNSDGDSEFSRLLEEKEIARKKREEKEAEVQLRKEEREEANRQKKEMKEAEARRKKEEREAANCQKKQQKEAEARQKKEKREAEAHRKKEEREAQKKNRRKGRH
jgi:superfamily II DNA helicase RecQ